MKSPGRVMRTLRASEIHADDAIRVIAIEAVHCHATNSGGLYRLFARIEPTAIVVCAEGENRVIGLAAANLSLQELKREVAGLGDLLNATRA